MKPSIPQGAGAGGPIRNGAGPNGGPLTANPNQLDRLSKMNPEQRERQLSKLPPERRAKIEQNLKSYNAMPEADRQHLKQQFENFKQMPPEQQEAVRKSFRQFTALPEDRRMVIRQELGALRSMTADQREQRMESGEFRSRFTPHERNLLDNLTKVMPPE